MSDEPFCQAYHCPVDASNRCDYPECMSDYVAPDDDKLDKLQRIIDAKTS